MCAVRPMRLALLAGVIAPVLAGQVVAQDDGKVRAARFAGSWYPGNAAALAKQIDDLFERASPPKVGGKPVAVIAPHAGYRYCAPVASAAYASLRDQTYKRVIVMAFSHQLAGTYQGVNVPQELTATLRRSATCRSIERPATGS